MYAILKSGQDLLKFSNNSFIMVSAYGRIAAKRLVYAYLGTCMPCPCAEILDKGWDANKPQAKKEVIEDAPPTKKNFSLCSTESVSTKLSSMPWLIFLILTVRRKLRRIHSTQLLKRLIPS